MAGKPNLSVTVQEASEGDSATLPATLPMAAEQVEAVQPAGAEVEEVVADKGAAETATRGRREICQSHSTLARIMHKEPILGETQEPPCGTNVVSITF